MLCVLVLLPSCFRAEVAIAVAALECMLGIFVLLPGLLRVELAITVTALERAMLCIFVLLPSLLRVELAITVTALECMLGIFVLLPGLLRVKLAITVVALERRMLCVLVCVSTLRCGEFAVAKATFKKGMLVSDVLLEGLLGVEHFAAPFTAIGVLGFSVLGRENEPHGQPRKEILTILTASSSLKERPGQRKQTGIATVGGQGVFRTVRLLGVRFRRLLWMIWQHFEV